jgi:hypothetical protein
MPYLWFVEGESRWTALPLSELPVDVGTDAPRAVAAEHFPVSINQERCRNATVIFPVGEGSSRVNVLVWGGGRSVRVNGLALTTGLRVLADKDEIAIGDRTPLFYTTESVAEIESFAGSAREIFCPRCTLPIGKDKLVVRCPNCGIIHHQDAELGCWTYAAGCAVCAHPTAMEAGFRWTPEESWN